ncbi:MAG: phosphatase PAP2 family protein [Tepidisphaeraceae bacterium]|jgi:undecaprenyl-diphosphatase
MDSSILLGSLGIACAGMLVAERLGAKVVLALKFKGDIKRETRWLAQYGQGACTIVVAGLLVAFDNHRMRYGLTPASLLLTVVFGTSLICMLLKRLLGRVRPNRENAGRFLGPTLKHDNSRESFPSSHSAAAVAMSVVLTHLYPQGLVVFAALAVACSVLRYVMDAHWPSDVLAGIGLGLALAQISCLWVGQ